jgi:Uma2 family endonuclease
MVVMTAVEATGRFTRADFEALPDEYGRRYELLDGAFVVTRAPTPAHQRATASLYKLLDAAVPDHLEVFLAPLDAYLPTGDILEPDVLVSDKRTIVANKVEGLPQLAVEVLSPSSPRLRARQLEDGEYVEVADVTGDEEWTSESPYAVTVRPAGLCDD